VATAALLAAGVASADDPNSLRDRAGALETQNAGLEDRERSAVLELYALATRLGAADVRIATLHAAATKVEREQAAARTRLTLVRDNLAAAQVGLAERLRALYVQGDPDPLEVLLGAESLEEALTVLDSLGRLAREDTRIVAQVRGARTAVNEALAALAREESRLAELTAEAQTARDALVEARADRASYLAGLRAEQRLNEAEIAELLGTAQAAESKAEEIQPPAPAPSGSPDSSPTPSPAPESGGRKLRVEATGYALRGTTATGIPTSWGVIAVDPSVIPLGTKMFVPGYGEGVAADTGSAVKGNIIDLWFPTTEQALQWGRRTVTITLH
jgi:peptidoglycan DL-endopeptidase CwlO